MWLLYSGSVFGGDFFQTPANQDFEVGDQVAGESCLVQTSPMADEAK